MKKSSMGLTALAVLGALGVGGYLIYQGQSPDSMSASTGQIHETVRKPPASPGNADDATSDTDGTESAFIELPHSLWESAGLQIAELKPGRFAEQIELTGKITFNEDRLAHIFPLVEGRVEHVDVQFGQKVKKSEPLLIVQSKEVGERMLQLFQDRLQLSFAKIKDEWTQEVGKNTQALIDMMWNNSSMEEIEAAFVDRPLGGYREQLMTAYVNYLTAQATHKRLEPLSEEGAVPGRQVMEAQARHDATRAILRSLLEQVSHDLVQLTRRSSQTVQELTNSVAVAEANLLILGFSREELKNINPAQQGESLAHYIVSAPFDGTIINKDVVLMERVSPDRQVLTIADLSTVWVTADVFETHLPLLTRLRNQDVEIHSESWPDKTFQAKVFYTGDVVQEETRTVAMRAVADNSEGLLKPGMFVTVKLPLLASEEVLQVPTTAVQDFAGATFVFVQTGDETFQRRDVRLGRRSEDSIEVLSGLQAGDHVVTRGGFALKSKMLSGLLSEE